VTTDWILLRRAAAELDRTLTRGRILDVGLLDDGRFAVRVGGLRDHGALTLAVDIFGSPPLVTLVRQDVALAGDPGWTRAIAAALRGMRVAGVRSRTGDRVLVLELATLSRFGVESDARLVLELVPRYGNVVLLRERRVVAAAKQFSPAENAARSVQAGMPYAPPPLPEATLDAGAFAQNLGGDAASRGRALGRYLPRLPRLLAESLVTEASQVDLRGAALATWLAERAAAMLAYAQSEAAGTDALYAYHDGAKLVAVHLLPLAQYAALTLSRESQLLPLWREARRDDRTAQTASTLERRRRALEGRIEKRRLATAAEVARVRAKYDDARGRDALRAAGDAIYTHAHEIPSGATSFVPHTQPDLVIALDPTRDPKANAQAYFARYRKATDALPHLEERLALLETRARSLEELVFEAERADDPTLNELTAALDEIEGRTAPAAAASRQRKKARAILCVERASGARIFVGRSPRENVEVTFRIARPDDLWFHARGIPSSHVVLQAAPGAPFVDDDIAAAANLAAVHSRARGALRVEVDYTERKYVRKQRDAGPGLVWYTNARTRVGEPARAVSATG
jgi:predicted ribosome quality control (RQC) complex YloA/Tae2 family protein